MLFSSFWTGKLDTVLLSIMVGGQVACPEKNVLRIPISIQRVSTQYLKTMRTFRYTELKSTLKSTIGPIRVFLAWIFTVTFGHSTLTGFYKENLN